MIAVTSAIRRLKFDKPCQLLAALDPRARYQIVRHDCGVTEITPIVSNIVLTGSRNAERISHVEVL